MQKLLDEGRTSVTQTVLQMVEEAQAMVPGIGPEEARRRSQEDPNTLIVDVRDAANRRASGMVEGGIAVSSGTLPSGDHRL